LGLGHLPKLELLERQDAEGTIEEVRNIAIESFIGPLIRQDLYILSINPLSTAQNYRKVISEDIRNKQDRFILLSILWLSDVTFHPRNLTDCALGFPIMDMAGNAA